MRIILTIAAALTLAGCAHGPAAEPETRIVTVKESVPVASPCVPATLGPAPDYPDTDAALKAAGPAGDKTAMAKRYKLLGAGRALRIARNRELETVVDGCPKVGQ